jgi:hypothetical protein
MPCNVIDDLELVMGEIGLRQWEYTTPLTGVMSAGTSGSRRSIDISSSKIKQGICRDI